MAAPLVNIAGLRESRSGLTETGSLWRNALTRALRQACKLELRVPRLLGDRMFEPACPRFHKGGGIFMRRNSESIDRARPCRKTLASNVWRDRQRTRVQRGFFLRR